MTGEKRLRVLIVDDEEDLVEMLAMRLEASGRFSVERAHDGITGLLKAESGSFDAVLLDGKMPGLSGWEVCKRLRDGGRTVPVVMMTAISAVEAQRRARDLGVDGLVLKPYDQTQVAAVLKDACRAKI